MLGLGFCKVVHLGFSSFLFFPGFSEVFPRVSNVLGSAIPKLILVSLLYGVHVFQGVSVYFSGVPYVMQLHLARSIQYTPSRRLLEGVLGTF